MHAFCNVYMNLVQQHKLCHFNYLVIKHVPVDKTCLTLLLLTGLIFNIGLGRARHISYMYIMQVEMIDWLISNCVSLGTKSKHLHNPVDELTY